jgi:hypothetical protein
VQNRRAWCGNQIAHMRLMAQTLYPLARQRGLLRAERLTVADVGFDLRNRTDTTRVPAAPEAGEPIGPEHHEACNPFGIP